MLKTLKDMVVFENDLHASIDYHLKYRVFLKFVATYMGGYVSKEHAEYLIKKNNLDINLRTLLEEKWIGDIKLKKGRYSPMYFLKYKSYKFIENNKNCRSYVIPTTRQTVRSLLIGELIVHSRFKSKGSTFNINHYEKSRFDFNFLDVYIAKNQKNKDGSFDVDVAIFMMKDMTYVDFNNMIIDANEKVRRLAIRKAGKHVDVSVDIKLYTYNKTMNKKITRMVEKNGYNFTVEDFDISERFFGEEVSL